MSELKVSEPEPAPAPSPSYLSETVVRSALSPREDVFDESTELIKG
jgi:hypothetical protein